LRYQALKHAEQLMFRELDDLDMMILAEACEKCQKKLAVERDTLFSEVGYIQQLLMEDIDESQYRLEITI
jgi:hypothetical protein